MTSPESTLNDKPTSRWLWIGCVLLVIGAGLHSADRVVGGGDTWVAMACGRYTLGQWALGQPNRTWQMRLLDKFGIHTTQQEPFGARSRAFEPVSRNLSSIFKRLFGAKDYDPKLDEVGWVNQNWLTHVMFYKMKNAWGEKDSAVSKGESLIVVYKFLQAILTVLFAYGAARVLGAHPMLAAATAAFGILLSRSFVDLRPNVSSILFAIIMIFLLSCWKKRRYWALAGMIPVMIIWSNVHGGFIYAIMIFMIMLGGHLVMRFLGSVWPGRLVDIDWRGYKLLLAGAAVVTIIPGIFSPFGWENLAHPLIIIMGQEGKIWRDVSEWRPIWDTDGFGNATPYVIFLSILGLVFVVWLVLFFMRPSLPQPHRRRERLAIEKFPWPRIDLAQWGIMAITIYMSMASRRFIFLGGVILSPFLAQMTQEIVDMVRLLRLHKQNQPLQLAGMPSRSAMVAATLSLTGALVMWLIFGLAMRDIYYRPPSDGIELSVFRRMVGIYDQPVGAMKFLNANKIEGVVFNEWTGGGYVAFGQDPDPQTGRPRCKVFIDGRAQAAYNVSHFTYWQTLKEAILPSTNVEFQKSLRQIAQSLKISGNDPESYDKLVGQAMKDKKLSKQLVSLAGRVPELYAAFQRVEMGRVIERIGSNAHDPQLYEKVAEYYRNDLQKLLTLSAGDPDLYGHLFGREGINVALVSLGRSPSMFKLFMSMKDWKLFYVDERNAVFLQKGSPLNQEFFQKDLAGLDYPDEFSRNYSLGMSYCQTGEPKEKIIEGIRALMSIEHYTPKTHSYIYGWGEQAGMHEELWQYFSRQQQFYRELIDKKEELGWRRNWLALCSSYEKLINLSRKLNRPNETQKYTQEFKKYISEYDEKLSEYNEKLLTQDEGWFW